MFTTNITWTDVTPPFNLHPWKWFEGYLVKSALFFSGWQKQLRFSRVATWEKKWAIVVQKEKRPGCFFSFWITMTLKKIWCHALENLRCSCHPEKNRADFTGYPSNHFQGCRLIGGLWEKIALGIEKKLMKAEGSKLATFLRTLKKFIRTVKGKNIFETKYFLIWYFRFRLFLYIRTIKWPIGTYDWD